MSQKRDELIQRVANTHDTWYVEERHFPVRHRYRLLVKKKGKPLFPNWMTSDQVHAFLDGYALGLKSAENYSSDAPPGWGS